MSKSDLNIKQLNLMRATPQRMSLSVNNTTSGNKAHVVILILPKVCQYGLLIKK